VESDGSRRGNDICKELSTSSRLRALTEWLVDAETVKVTKSILTREDSKPAEEVQ